MKKNIALILFCLMAVSFQAVAQSNREARVAYVLQNLGIDRAHQKALRPVLNKYLAEKKQASADYDEQKDRWKELIKKGKLTDAQANKLLQMKWEAEQKELNLKKQYTTRFGKVLPAAKVWYCFDLVNDKKSKIRGEEKNDDDE
ncbi:MAG: hypothetical protein HUK02_04005 [Bacteroidaceae bacterium]|nr:hypothetical protein [Bacteroidaceae bacterium]